MEIDAGPGQAAEHILAGIAGRLQDEPAASLSILRSMLTNAEAAEAVGSAAQRYQANLIAAIPAEDAGLRAAIILGITVSRHLIKSDELADADPQRVVKLLRAGIQSLTDPVTDPVTTAAIDPPTG